jgi:hypothetical protein
MNNSEIQKLMKGLFINDFKKFWHIFDPCNDAIPSLPGAPQHNIKAKPLPPPFVLNYFVNSPLVETFKKVLLLYI